MPFDQVKERIREFLKQRDTQQALQAEIQALRAKGKVETSYLSNGDTLGEVSAMTRPRSGPSGPGGAA